MLGRGLGPGHAPVCSTFSFGCPWSEVNALLGLEGQVLFPAGGGPRAAAQSRLKAGAHFQLVGRCRIRRLARWAMRAGRLMTLLRRVSARTRAMAPPIITAVARIRL